MMKSSAQLGFISSRIEELRTAIFHSQSTTILNLNPAVISILKVDTDGYFWFLVDKPLQAVSEFEKQFPVDLNFYKKGAMFFLNVFGIARMITDPEELELTEIDNKLTIKENDKILIRVKIVNVNYFEKKNSAKGWLTKRKKAFIELFVPRREMLSPARLLKC
jgi:general stress protein 26